MNNEEFSDNSDSDDVDFNPDIGNAETESDDSLLDEDVSEGKGSKSTEKGKKKKAKGRRKRKAGDNDSTGAILNDTEAPGAEANQADLKTEQEKLLEAEAEEKARTDRLWADFLGSVESDKKRKSSSFVEETKKVTKVYNFAGQRLEVEEEVKVPCSSKSDASKLGDKTENGDLQSADGEAKSGSDAQPDARDRSHIPKRRKICFLSGNPDEIGLGADSKGLKSVVNALFAKNKKVNTLYKTKIDWNKYKQENKIDDELKLHRNSKDGYVDKQEFLQRTDVREFERERDLRATARRKNQNQLR